MEDAAGGGGHLSCFPPLKSGAEKRLFHLLGRVCALANSGHPFGDGHSRAPRRSCAYTHRFCLRFIPLHGIYLFNKQYEEQRLVSQWPVLHWLLAIGKFNQL